MAQIEEDEVKRQQRLEKARINSAKYYETHKEEKKQYYLKNKEKLGYGRFESKCGVYVISNSQNPLCWVGSSKNVRGRYETHKNTTLKGRPEDWKVDVFYWLPSCFSIKDMSSFEFIAMQVLKADLMNTYNTDDKHMDFHVQRVFELMPLLNDQTRAKVTSHLELLKYKAC